MLVEVIELRKHTSIYKVPDSTDLTNFDQSKVRSDNVNYDYDGELYSIISITECTKYDFYGNLLEEPKYASKSN